MTCCAKTLGEHTRFTFHPDYDFTPVTEKFYARHEHLVVLDPPPPNVAFYENEIDKRLHRNPHENCLAPRTENQVYGWLEQLAPRYISEEDRDLMLYPKKTDEAMNVLHKIAGQLHIQRRKFGSMR